MHLLVQMVRSVAVADATVAVVVAVNVASVLSPLVTQQLTLLL
jgi:hypothetical protein